MFILERERQSMNGKRQREGDTESKAGSGLRAVGTEPDTELEPKNHDITTSAEVGRPTD